MARIGRKKMARKPRRKVARRPIRRGRVGRMPKATTGNFASAMETFSVAVTAGVVNDFTLSMADLTRTRALLSVYQYYRITTVEMRFKPQSDSFIAGAGAQLPYLYFQYDKSGSLQGLNAQNFEEIGTKAIRFDDKTLIRKWKPSVLTDALSTSGTTQFKVSPWLPTLEVGSPSVNAPDHYGAIFYISKQNPSDATVYDVDVVVNVQYRKPLITPSQGVTNVNPPRIKQGNTTAVDVSLNPHIAQV